ncbi:hypothetical protein ABN214_15770 [Proteus terrae]|uniref:hypothetical protein n=1 Tax=Proteus terrae TaxID=1574161 RepID=UPI0032DA8D87
MKTFKFETRDSSTQPFEHLKSDFSWTVGVTNLTGRDLSLRTHYGVSTQINRNNELRREKGFEVALTIRLRRDVLFDIAGLSIEDLPPEYEVIQKALADETTMSTMELIPCGINHYVITVTFFYTLDWLLSQGGEIYLPLADMVVSLNQIQDTMYHPRSVEHTLAGVLFEEVGGVNFNVELVDRKDRVGCKFLNLKGDVYLLKPVVVTDHEDVRPDGLYIGSTRPIKYGSLLGRKEPTKFIRMETLAVDPTKYGLYTTRQEAISLGGKDIDQYVKMLDAAQDKTDKLLSQLSEKRSELKSKEDEIKKLRFKLKDLEVKVRDGDKMMDNLFSKTLDLLKIVGGWLIKIPAK